MQVKKIYENISSSFPNFKSRDNTQLKMALEIEKCFIKNQSITNHCPNILMIEAPTGTGKSIAYLMSGIEAAKSRKKIFIIATATKTLQNQLIDNDIAILKEYGGINFTYALAKGRSNYLCPYQLNKNLSQQNQDDLFSFSNSDLEKLSKVEDYFNNGWNGDIEQLPFEISLKQKQMITTDKDRCLNYYCEYNKNNQCPFYLNKEKLKKVDVVVTNHSLLLSHIEIQDGGVLPFKLSDTLLCIDEAHNFIDNAIKNFTKSFKLISALNNFNNMAKFFNHKNKNYFLKDFNDNNNLLDLIRNSINLFENLNIIIDNHYDLFQDKQLILNEYINKNIGIEFYNIFHEILVINNSLHISLQDVITKLKDELKTNPDSIMEKNLSAISLYSGIIEEIVQTCKYITNKDDCRYNAHAKWIEINPLDLNDFTVCAGVTDVSNILALKLWNKVDAAVITSATLSISEDFNYYMHLFGLHLLSNVKTHKLPISFDYSSQSQIFIPNFKFSPEFILRDEFNIELADFLNKTLNYSDGYGTLVLFYNSIQMSNVYNLLIKSIQKNILLQTDFISNQRLIVQHKKNIDNKKPSIIFGLNSFSEGVDLSGIYCIHVIISKLPFEANKNPYNIVQEYWIKSENRNYFFDVSLPKTCIKLIQATGRLIRSENDYGQVTICDNRIISKNYGLKLKKSLMPFNSNYKSDFILTSFNILKR